MINPGDKIPVSITLEAQLTPEQLMQMFELLGKFVTKDSVSVTTGAQEKEIQGWIYNPEYVPLVDTHDMDNVPIISLETMKHIDQANDPKLVARAFNCLVRAGRNVKKTEIISSVPDHLRTTNSHYLNLKGIDEVLSPPLGYGLLVLPNFGEGALNCIERIVTVVKQQPDQ